MYPAGINLRSSPMVQIYVFKNNHQSYIHLKTPFKDPLPTPKTNPIKVFSKFACNQVNREWAAHSTQRWLAHVPSRSLNVHTQYISVSRGLMFGLSLYLLSCINHFLHENSCKVPPTMNIYMYTDPK